MILPVVLAAIMAAQQAAPAAPQRTILAIGAHAGDVELTSGALLLKAKRRGDRTVILHLTLGERGHPTLPPAEYAEQKRREATAAAEVLGAEVIFGPYRDGELPDDEETRRYVADVIRRIRPTLIVTHWRRSMHRDHATASSVVGDAVLLASLEGVTLTHPRWRGVRGVWFAENWEDADEFRPYVYLDVTGHADAWKEAVTKYEFVRGGMSSFPYLDYYTALAALRGAEVRRKQAIAFDIDPLGKRRVLDELP